VLLDGARLNDPRNNAVPLETLSLDAIERIEIVRGASAATVGGGSAGGVVNISDADGLGTVRHHGERRARAASRAGATPPRSPGARWGRAIRERAAYAESVSGWRRRQGRPGLARTRLSHDGDDGFRRERRRAARSFRRERRPNVRERLAAGFQLHDATTRIGRARRADPR
jgi:outer membrane receptor protein involved in Fe transport